jgi:hypothetical protein
MANTWLRGNRSNVEQSAVKIEILETEDCPIRKAARIVSEDQLAVVMLHGLVVGDGVITERENDNRREYIDVTRFLL